MHINNFKEHFKAIALSLTIVEFKTELAESINTLRAAYNAQPETQTKAPKLVVEPSPKIKITPPFACYYFKYAH